MRQIVLFFLCTIANLVMAQEKIEYRYWFDNSNETIQTGLSDKNDFHLDIDASNLKTGLHSFNYQILDGGKGESSVMSSLFYKSSSFLNKKSIVSIDGKVIKDYSVFTNNPSLIKIDVDAQSLDLGVHTLSVQVVDDSGVSSSNIEAFFTKVPTQGDIQSMNLYYMIDNNIGKKQSCVFTNSLACAEIDASSLSDGQHSITFFMYNPNGLSTQAKSTFFIKEPLGGNGIKAYKYWLNEDVEHCQEKEFDPTKAEVKIVGLFDMEHPELRSSNFHFAIENDKAVLYPKNTFNLRVNDVSGRITSSKSDYIDVTKRELLDMNSIVPIASGQSYANSVSDKNGISWFQFTGKDGDSISVRANRACMLEVYSPSGKILHQTDGYDATTAKGMFLEEDGTYYVALHDVRTSAKDVNLDFYQIAKYAVVSYDTHTVGNGGLTTINFKGNGFYSLEDISLESGSQKVPLVNIDRNSNTEVSATFDFLGVDTSHYDIVMNFGDESVKINKGITVEKAKDITLVKNIDFEPIFYIGHEPFYNLTITNEGNNTAYKVPVYIYIETKLSDGFPRIRLMGTDDSFWKGIDVEDYSEEEINILKEVASKIGSGLSFSKLRKYDNQKKDSILISSGYFFVDISPMATKKLSVSIATKDSVTCLFAVPETWNAFSTQTAAYKAKKVSSRTAKESFCCYHDKVECFLNVTANLADMTSMVAGGFPPTVPQAKVTEAVADITNCVASLLSNISSTASDIFCSEYVPMGEKNLYDKLMLLSQGVSLASFAKDCISRYLLGKWVGNAKERFELLNNLSTLNNYSWGSVGTTIDCVSSLFSKKPNCPPIPPGGGQSNPINAYDPNDILGYVAPSGSHYIGVNQKKLGYTIEFENDATKATASAHEIVIKDKLDANIFDCNSIHTSKIVIGKHEVDVDADGEFVKTIDMRPAINALAEVKLNISSNGEVVYSITSLDPMTAESTTDMMAGILPINNANKDGEGYIVFDVKLKEGLADGTKIDNEASIIFDANDAISTPVWSNETDYVMPVGYVDGIKQLDSNHIKIEMDGIDERSGIWKYDLYYQAGAGSSWFPLAEDLTANTYEMEVYDDIDYGFCVVATDKAGNKEVKELSRDYSYLNGVITSGIEKVETNNSNLKGRVYDLSGRRVKGKPSKGIYIVKGKKILFQ